MNKNNKTKAKLSTVAEKVSVELPDLEYVYLRKFFGLNGMREAFLEEHPSKDYNRTKLDYALEVNKFRVGLLSDIRVFVDENKSMVDEFLDIPNEHQYEQSIAES